MAKESTEEESMQMEILRSKTREQWNEKEERTSMGVEEGNGSLGEGQDNSASIQQR